MTDHLAGRIVDKIHLQSVRIYYEDTDFSGFVYHANYLKFCERGRSDFLRLIGVHHHELHWSSSGNSIGFVVTRMDCEFRAPARIDDVVEVATRLTGSSGVRFMLDQRISRGKDLLFRAKVTAALVDSNAKPVRLPKPVHQALLPFLSD